MRFLLLLRFIGLSFCGILDYYNVIEGDIPTNKNILRTRRSALASPDSRWPKAVVPYQISVAYTTSEKQQIYEAMDEIAEKTCVRFREARESDQDRIRIVKAVGCASPVGRIGGTQDVWLLNYCFTRWIILRQLMFALGFTNRPDRDDYITINWENVPSNRAHSFKKRNLEDVTLMDTPYSYDSIMHYPSDVFAKGKNQPTIVAKNPTKNMGGGDHLSEIDVTRIRKLYCS